jgi:hypothetical protein
MRREAPILDIQTGLLGRPSEYQLQILIFAAGCCLFGWLRLVFRGALLTVFGSSEVCQSEGGHISKGLVGIGAVQPVSSESEGNPGTKTDTLRVGKEVVQQASNEVNLILGGSMVLLAFIYTIMLQTGLTFCNYDRVCP